MHYWEIFAKGYKGYASYLWQEITNPSWHNYFYWLILVSCFFFFIEILQPWRKKQKVLRKDFWLDAFYMFFNFFLFSLIIYNATSEVVVEFFNNIIISISSFDLQAANPLRNLPMWAILIIGFVVRDFVQWWTHRLLHYSNFLWEFHKVHHSVEEMGFAAHLRYHWMETIVYRSIEYIPLALMGIGLYDFFVIHIFTLAVGHYNHSNITVPGTVSGAVIGFLIGLVIAFGLADVHILGSVGLMEQVICIAACTAIGFFLLGPIMKFLFNSPEMHIWHHAQELPRGRRYGVNFGLTLAAWDYIFGTAYVPHNGRDIALGFPDLHTFPKTFGAQVVHGFKKRDS